MTDRAAAERINDIFANIGKNLSEKINRKITKDIKSYKSSGLATISSRIWKLFCSRFDSIMVHLYNLILTLCEYPQDQKLATVVPIPKITNANKPGELRPISLLPLPGKILEHHIHDNIQDYLDREGLLSKYQNNFRKSHSTKQTVFKYTTDLMGNDNDNLTSIATYIDV